MICQSQLLCYLAAYIIHSIPLYCGDELFLEDHIGRSSTTDLTCTNKLGERHLN